MLLTEKGDVEGAREAYQFAIDSGHSGFAPAAALSLGVLLGEQGDVEGARRVLRVVIDSGHKSAAPKAAVSLEPVIKPNVSAGQPCFRVIRCLS
ncbi:MAG TPA: hypothetical protein VG228_02255, partial [Solirubrobacteraceae bacterium]|nr:hypothetical protein [Solirubrobacteraceae bacterium]